MEFESIPKYIIIFLAIILLIFILVSILNVDGLLGVGSMVTNMAKNIFSNAAF